MYHLTTLKNITKNLILYTALYLDDLTMTLNERFESHNENITSLQYVLSSIVVKKPFSYLKKAVEFYENDLPRLNHSIEVEYEI